jgi:hypothetical protein
MFRLLFLLLGSAVCFMSTVADDLYGGFNQSAAFTVTTADLSLTDRPTDRPIDEAVPFSSVESVLRSTGSLPVETSLSLSILTTAVQAFFTLCPQPGQIAPPLTTENFYLLQDWQQEIKAMPADLSKFPACSEQITAFANVLNESSGECSFTQRQEMQTAYQSVAECAGVTTIIEPLGNVEMDLYRKKMVLVIWHSALVRWQQSPESAELMADLQQKSLELLNTLSGSENVQYRQLIGEISELYALLSLSLEESEPYLSQAKQQANNLIALVTTQASGMQFRFYQPDAGNESSATDERCGCSWKRSNFRVLPQPPASQPLAAYEPWQITYNYTLTGNPAECPLPDYVQVSLRLGHKQNRFVGKHTEKYVSGASGKAVILFKEGPYGPGIYNVQLTLREANDKESAQFDLGSHEWKYLGTIIKSIEARQGDNFKLNYPPNFSTGPAWLPVDPLSKLDLKLSLIKGINPMNETLVIYYAPPNFNPVSDKFIELLREPLRERLIISFALMPAELQNLPKGRGSIMAFLESASSGEFPTLRNVGLRNSHPKSLSMVTEIFETMFIKGWEECEKKLPEVLIVTDSVSGVSRFPEVVTCDFSVVNADGKAEIYPLNEIRVLEECSKFLHPEMEEKWENLLDEIGLRRHYGPPESFSPGVVKVQDSPWNEIVEKSGNYSRIGLRVFHPRNPNNIDDRYFYSIKKKNDSFRVVFSSYAHFYPNYHPKNPEYVPKDKFFLELKTPLPGRIYFTWGNYRFRLWGKPLSDESGAQKHEDTIMLMKNQWLKDKQTGLPLWLLKSLEHYVSLANGGSAPVRRTFAPFSFNVGGKQLGNGKEKIQIEAGFMPKAGGAFYDTKGLIQFGVNSHLSRTNGSSVMSGGFRPEFAENVEFKVTVHGQKSLTTNY